MEMRLTMKKSTGYILVTVIIIILMISSLVIYAKSNNKEPTLEDKVVEEIKYLDSYIVSLLGHFNGLTIGDQVFQTSQPKTQLGKQPETNPKNAGSQENNSEKGTANEENSQQSNLTNNGSKENTQTGEASSPTGQTGQEDNVNQTGKNGNMTQNGIFASNGNNPNWEIIQIHIEQLYQTWNAISLDLHALKVDGSSILAFSDGLNATTQNVKKKDKTKAMEELNKIYQLLPSYMEKCKPNSEQTKLLSLEAQVVNAYVLVTSEKWEKASTELAQTEKQFANILNSVSTTTEKRQSQTTMNQCYILVNELKNAINLKDKEIFYIQYQNFITKIGVII